MSVSTIQNYVRQLKENFKRDGIIIDMEWLKECTAFFLSNDEGLTTKQLYEQAMDQWQLSDITCSSSACFPPIVQSSEPKQLIGKFAVQLQYIIDISEPCYDQLRKLYNKHLDETSEEQQQRESIKKKRVLKLQLTDGVQTIYAMEYHKIPTINVELTPGCKILLMGPIRYINRVLLLESTKNIVILGGESEQLLIENAYENVLLRALGKPIKTDPIKGYQMIDGSGGAGGDGQITNTAIMNSNSADLQLNDDADLFLNLDIDMLDTNQRETTTTTTTNNNNNNQSRSLLSNTTTRTTLQLERPAVNTIFSEFDDDDDNDLILIDNDELENVPNQPTNQQPIQNPTTINTKPIVIADDYDDDDFLLDIENEMKNEITRNNNQQSSTARVNVKEIEMKTVSLLDDDGFDEDVFVEDSSNAPKKMQPIKNQAQSSTIAGVQCKIPLICDIDYEFKIRRFNVVLIDQLLAIGEPQKLFDKTFILKGEIMLVIEKLQIKKKDWSLGVLLKDGHSKEMLPVRLHSDVIAELAGISAIELYTMKKSLAERPQLKEEVFKILEQLKEKLTKLNCFMKISYCSTLELVTSSTTTTTTTTTAMTTDTMISSQSSNKSNSSAVTTSPPSSTSLLNAPTVIELIESTTYFDRILTNKLQSENYLK